MIVVRCWSKIYYLGGIELLGLGNLDPMSLDQNKSATFSKSS